MRKSACWTTCLAVLSLVVDSGLVASQQPTSAPDSSPGAADYNWIKYAIFPADDRSDALFKSLAAKG